MLTSRPSSPAERCLRTLWAGRLPFLAIVAVFTGAAAIVTTMQPVLFASRALLSIRPPAEVLEEAVRTQRPSLGLDGKIYDRNDPDRQSGPGRYAPRLSAPGMVTLAARDAGVLSGAESLDDVQAARWVTAERIEGADLIKLTVWQPTAEAAQRIAAAIVARALAINERDEAAAALPELRRILLVVDPPTRPSAPAYPLPAVNLSVGFALGVLAASAFIAMRGAWGTRS
jgi:uncharacterized protein involved in exopolysaccharide biosynthesis